MRNIYFLAALTIFLGMYFSMANAVEEKTLTYEQLFIAKCSVCHSPTNAEKIHGSREVFMNKIAEMQRKQGANISKEEAAKIAEYLSDPNRFVFETKCTKCHTMERISKLHMKGVTAEEMKKIIGTMCNKTNADIPAEAKKAITEHNERYCTVK